ncbi:hypothetical protein SAMN04487759_10141 [Kandleria vitulina]|uniref:Helix-turn-helix n=1 Tax=Kandleria vitulina TaxID=1630 RepID=A0A1H2PWG8_9FIRM|nr:hypothetical protein [Kandleria vitulina]SDV99242.1 hypothetical protein SAMN04487759_10141 [Kandleria vitulina]
MKTFNDVLNEQMQNNEFKKEYEAIQPGMNVIRAIVDARTYSKELDRRSGINQADISKIEYSYLNIAIIKK